MASRTSICNIALARIGVSRRLNNVDTERSLEAQTMRTFIDEDIAYVLRDFPWPWATAYVNLSLVAGSASEMANADWRYSYRYPTDCMYARRLVLEQLGRDNPNPPKWRIGRDSQGKLIFTNEEDAVLEYTQRIDDVAEFDSMFVSQLAWKLGAGAAPSLSRVKNMAETCMSIYEIDKTKAQSRALNEAQQSDPQEAEMIRARD